MNMRARTFVCDNAQVAMLQELGLDAMSNAPDPDEDPEVYISRLTAKVIGTRQVHRIVAHYLLPLGKTETDWTPELAAEIAEHLAGVQEESERAALFELAAELTFGFFQRGVLWLETSRKSLDDLAVAMSALDDLSNRGTAAHSSSSSARPGRRMFGESLVTTIAGLWRSLTRRSARA